VKREGAAASSSSSYSCSPNSSSSYSCSPNSRKSISRCCPLTISLPIALYLQCLEVIYSAPRLEERTSERHGISHTLTRFKRSKGVKLNGIFECRFLSKPEDHTQQERLACQLTLVQMDHQDDWLLSQCLRCSATDSIPQSYDRIVPSRSFLSPSVLRHNLQCRPVKSSGLPRGMPLVTRMFASSEHAWDQMASSSAKFCLKTRTVPTAASQQNSCHDMARWLHRVCCCCSTAGSSTWWCCSHTQGERRVPFDWPSFLGTHVAFNVLDGIYSADR
jgi:hypothetical protein